MLNKKLRKKKLKKWLTNQKICDIIITETKREVIK